MLACLAPGSSLSSPRTGGPGGLKDDGAEGTEASPRRGQVAVGGLKMVFPGGREDPSSSRGHGALQYTRAGRAHREGAGRAQCRAASEARHQREGL